MGRRKGLSPTQRTLAALRDRGMTAAVVEKWNAFASPFGIRQDLFGFIDVLALDPERPGHGFLGVQCCAGSGLAAHRTKIIVECNQEAFAWVRAGGRIEIWGWRKVKLERGGKAMRWVPRVVQVGYLDLLPKYVKVVVDPAMPPDQVVIHGSKDSVRITGLKTEDA